MKSPSKRQTPGTPASSISEALTGKLPPEALDRLLQSLARQWKRYRKGLKECQREFSEPAVHNSRVETRRLLSMLELLGPFLGATRLEKARRALKRHLDTFDELRDTHVQLLAVARFKSRHPVASDFEVHLLKREKRLGRRTRKNIKGIRTKRLNRLLTAWEDDIGRKYSRNASGRARSMLVNGLRKAFARTARLKARIDPTDTRSIHRTRVAFKRFRYMVEIVTCLVPGSYDRLLKAMHHYQTQMGVIQDAEVLLAAFDKFLLKRAESPQSAARFRAQLVRRKEELVRRYLQHADELHVFDPSASASGG